MEIFHLLEYIFLWRCFIVLFEIFFYLLFFCWTHFLLYLFSIFLYNIVLVVLMHLMATLSYTLCFYFRLLRSFAIILYIRISHLCLCFYCFFSICHQKETMLQLCKAFCCNICWKYGHRQHFITKLWTIKAILYCMPFYLP